MRCFGDHDLIFTVTARHFTPRKYWLNTQEAMAPSRHDCWDVKPQHNTTQRSLRHLNCQIYAKICLYARYLLNLMADFNQICMDVTLGHDKELIRFLLP